MVSLNRKKIIEILVDKFRYSPEEVEEALSRLQDLGYFSEGLQKDEVLMEENCLVIKMPQLCILPLERISAPEKQQKHWRKVQASKKQSMPKARVSRRYAYWKKSRP